MEENKISEKASSQTEKISIIIPTYNVEKYIERCLKSVVNQTYKNLEIIVVDDFSNDNTFSIIQYISNQDNRIRIFRNNHHGVSCARNLAIKKSTGRYIMFLDGDDEYENDMVQAMYEHISLEEVEMVVCNYANIFSNKIDQNAVYSEDGVRSVKEYLKDDAAKHHVLYYGAIWNKIYDANIIREKRIIFDDTITLGEDTLFNIKYLKYVKKIYVIKKVLYNYYRENQGSLTKKLSSIDTWETTIKIYNEYIKLFEYEKLIDVCKKDISFIILSNMIFPLEEVLKDNSINLDKAISVMKRIINNDVIKFALNNAFKLSITDKIIKYTSYINNYMLMYVLLKIKMKIHVE